ncbi:MAG: GTPase domain-containing protein [Burkholderiales bacterium]|nr:GTPase domain-containing protein [Burkholderiales bacterium]
MNELLALDQVAPAKDINVFVAAHTNVGKTALLRTLLGRDVGAIEDRPDVTTATTSYELVAGTDGSALLLWDTPGFGDSFRLARRLGLRYKWQAWLMREVLDRRRNPPLWRGQRLALDLRARADVVLYPVSLLERPIDAIYVAPELEVLGWAGKPVLVILNQGGQLSNGDAAARVAEWRSALATHPVVQSVFDLDAFTRCWLQGVDAFRGNWSPAA